MAVRAPDFTFFDLSLNGRPAIRLVNELVNRLSLQAWVDVVEIEHKGIGNSAVNAGVLEQNFPDPLLEHECQGSGALCVSSDVRCAIRGVMLSAELRYARLTDSMPLS